MKKNLHILTPIPLSDGEGGIPRRLLVLKFGRNDFTKGADTSSFPFDRKDGENILPEFENGMLRSDIVETVIEESEFLKSKGFPAIRAIIKHPQEEILAGMQIDNVLMLNKNELLADVYKGTRKEKPYAGRDFFVWRDRLRNTVTHEFGHLVYNAIARSNSSMCQEAIRSIKAWYDSDASSGDPICGWENEREWFAENYAFWRMKRTDLLSKAHGNEILEIFTHLKEYK